MKVVGPVFKSLVFYRAESAAEYRAGSGRIGQGWAIEKNFITE
jgi:hypothetical protein